MHVKQIVLQTTKLSSNIRFYHKYFIFQLKTTAYEIRYQNPVGAGIAGIQ
jgi:hypothetical protein